MGGSPEAVLDSIQNTPLSQMVCLPSLPWIATSHSCEQQWTDPPRLMHAPHLGFVSNRVTPSFFPFSEGGRIHSDSRVVDRFAPVLLPLPVQINQGSPLSGGMDASLTRACLALAAVAPLLLTDIKR